ncbi:MFS transporter [Bifidobacterium simiarum]|uniref:Major facilitator superfamily (MFS) profile domain-containing protein n=1 Tax=Bifidobacterium simiarum TaxID=2045441 RepID=A0A2M9HCY4_9BIFI|nr:MFS transporter [Bifidobacterium simiarum]PJM74675.1 hypothetical protein CSQ87_09065 [Bifidobacterium simiarum]
MSNRPSSPATGTSATDVDAVADKARKALFPLLFVYLLGVLCLQAFNLVFEHIGTDLGAVSQASLITAIPGVVLGIVCFVYGSLCDFVSLKKLTFVGLILLWVGCAFGFLLHGNLMLVIIARCIQTIGFQAAGSVYLVIVARYLKPESKLLYFGLFTAVFQLSTALGVLCGGLFSAIDWSWLFLIPALSVLVVPLLLKDLPDSASHGTRIDVIGFALFGAGALFLTLFFSDLTWPLIIASAVAFVGFAIYISRAKNPFITPAFFRNTRWIKAVLLIVIFYSLNFSVTPLFNAAGSVIYGMSSTQVSLLLLPALILATVTGTLSGRIVDLIGRFRAILLAGTLMALGLVLSGAYLYLSAGSHTSWPLAAAISVYYIGMAMTYSPVVDTVLGTLPPEQSGRGVGMNDLAMQGSGAIGIAIFGSMISVAAYEAKASATDAAVSSFPLANAYYGSKLFIYAAVMVFGVLWLVVHRKALYQTK